LLFSVVVRVSCVAARLPSLALAAGLAVHQAVKCAAPRAEVGLKWPNDVLAGGRKLAGILVETATGAAGVEAVVVGVGINVHTRAFPAELSERATSVALLSDTPPNRGELLADTLAALDRDLHVVAHRGLGMVRARLDRADVLRGRRVRSDAGVEGIACGIDDDGRLMVLLETGGRARWSSGEVQIVLRP
jgi:BirA family biotin operon repressor/biotin-[acetyl-CoA-carboxylase] ligase